MNPPDNTFAIPRAQLKLFLPNDKLIEDFERFQGNVINQDDAITQAQSDATAALASAGQANSRLSSVSFLTALDNTALVGQARQLTVSDDLLALDGGAGAPFALGLNQVKRVLPADVVDLTAAFVNVPGMSCPVVANSTYLIEGALTFQSGGGAVGIGLAFTLPAAAQISGAYSHPATATGAQTVYNSASGAVNSNTTAVPATGANLPISGRWMVRTGANGGTMQLQMRTGLAATAVTLKADLSSLLFRKLA